RAWHLRARGLLRDPRATFGMRTHSERALPIMNARGRRGIRIASSKLAANKEVRHEATAAFRDGRPGGRAVVRLPRPRAAGTATNPAAATPHATEPAAAADGADHVRTNHAVHQRRQLLRQQ